MNINKILNIIILLFLVSLNLKSEENKYDIYSKGINYVLHKEKSIFESTYLNNLCISEHNGLGGDLIADLQKDEYKKIIKFSEDLAYRFKRNKVLETRIKDSFKLDFPYIFLLESEVWEYFSIESNKHKSSDELCEYYTNGALLNVSEIIYNKRQDKAAYFIFFISATSLGGRGYLILSEKKNNKWHTRKSELIVRIH